MLERNPLDTPTSILYLNVFNIMGGSNSDSRDRQCFKVVNISLQQKRYLSTYGISTTHHIVLVKSLHKQLSTQFSCCFPQCLEMRNEINVYIQNYLFSRDIVSKPNHLSVSSFKNTEFTNTTTTTTETRYCSNLFVMQTLYRYSCYMTWMKVYRQSTSFIE